MEKLRLLKGKLSGTTPHGELGKSLSSLARPPAAPALIGMWFVLSEETETFRRPGIPARPGRVSRIHPPAFRRMARLLRE